MQDVYESTNVRSKNEKRGYSMKRKIAAILCSVMCLGVFTGCSTDELSYLQMSVDMMQNMEQSETKGSVTVALDLAEIQRFVHTLAVSQGASAQNFISEDVLEKWHGTQKVQLNYTMQMDMEKMAYVFDVDAVYEGKTYSFGNWYYSMTEGIYISAETVGSVHQLMKDFDMIPADSVFAGEEYTKDLQAMLKQNEYICVFSPEDMGMTAEELKAQMPKDGFKELYQAAFDMYREGLSGFSSDLITKTENGYHIEADGTKVGQLFVSLLDYIAKNPDQVLDSVENYLVAAMKYNTPQDSINDLQDAFAEMKENWNETSVLIHSIKTAVEGALGQEAIAKALSGFHYSADIKKANDGYALAEAYTLTQDNKEILSITSKSTTKSGKQAVVVPQNSIDMEQMKDKLDQLEDKYNPITGLSITWTPADESMIAWTDLQRMEDEVFSSGIDALEYVVMDGRIYLPLRTTCDILGENVVWDKESRTAFVKQGDNRIRLDSRLVDGTSYIGVRGLEAAGYAVDYSKEDGVHTVVLSK